MSFKHTSFSGSEIMRSLEKVAIEKGLIQPEKTLKKEASLQKKADLTPSNNLLSNIVKLCSGLQSAGLDHFSRDLENAFFNFKTASKNSGEDLIHEAHPKGSHRLKDMLGDAVIETIIDQQLQDLKMVQKNPTGKLSTAREIIKAVKIVLAEDQGAVKSSLQSLLGSLNLINYAFQKQNWLTRPLATPEALIQQVSAFNKLGKISMEDAQKLKIDVNDLKNTLDPGKFGLTGVHQNVWAEMLPFFNNASLALENLMKALKESPKPVSSAVDSIKTMEGVSELREFNKEKSNAKFKLEQLESLVNSNQDQNKAKFKPAMLNWIKNTRTQIDGLSKKILEDVKEEFPGGNADPARKKELIQRRMDQLKNDLTVDFDNQLQIWSK